MRTLPLQPLSSPFLSLLRTLRPTPLHAFCAAAKRQRLARWAAAHPTYTPNTLDEHQKVQAAAPLMGAANFHAISHHPIVHAFHATNLLATAITRKDKALFPLLMHGSWASHASFQHTLLGVLDLSPAEQDIQQRAATVLASMADCAISKGDWSQYARAIAAALRQGHIGVVPWAMREGLPLFDCLPVREQMSSVYGVGTDEASFRLASFLGQRSSAHQEMRAKCLLSTAGTHAASALFSPHPNFRDACLRLPTL